MHQRSSLLKGHLQLHPGKRGEDQDLDLLEGGMDKGTREGIMTDNSNNDSITINEGIMTTDMAIALGEGRICEATTTQADMVGSTCKQQTCDLFYMWGHRSC